MIILKIKINGILLTSSLDYDKIHKAVENNTYNGLGDAVISKISDAVHNSEWYQDTPYKFDLFNNFHHVQAICGDLGTVNETNTSFIIDSNNLACWMDSANWTIMNKTPLTSDIYKFISERSYVIRHGLNNFPYHIISILIGLVF
jgi:hypothetical protein